MLSNLGWQDLETRRRITDLTMFLKIKAGNEGYLSRTSYVRWAVPTLRELVHSTHSSSIVAHLMLMHISFLFS